MYSAIRLMCWFRLANQRASLGHGLAAGELVLLGSLVRTHWVDGPSNVVASNSVLGDVSVELY